jgi:hypothetical protein
MNHFAASRTYSVSTESDTLLFVEGLKLLRKQVAEEMLKLSTADVESMTLGQMDQREAKLEKLQIKANQLDLHLSCLRNLKAIDIQTLR